MTLNQLAIPPDIVPNHIILLVISRTAVKPIKFLYFQCLNHSKEAAALAPQATITKMLMLSYALISSYHVQYQSDSRPVWSRTSDCQSGNPGSNPGCRILIFRTFGLIL